VRRLLGLEASLDIQWFEGINPAITSWFWLESDPEAWMYTFTIDFLTAVDYPSILSLSYGLPEMDQCQYFNPSDCHGVPYQQYVKIVDRQFQKIGLIGVSIIVCSQDRGVYAPDPPAGAAAVNPFLPEYPGTSVYVSGVGATEFGNPQFNLPNPPPACNSTRWSCASGGDEQAVSLAISFYPSGGGFSSVNLQPSYQSTAVNGYLNSGIPLPNSTVYNATGRGYPDISAIGYNGFVIDQGQPDLVSGTSMSTPIVAAIFGLILADYQQRTGNTLGFLNPALYKGIQSNPGIFYDITVGDNCASAGCKGAGGMDGFLCTKGWDPVTGLGTPRYNALSAYFGSLGDRVVARRAAKASANTRFNRHARQQEKEQ